MSRTSEVIKNRNKIEKLQKKRREDNMRMLKRNSAYKAVVFDLMKEIDIMLNDKDIESIAVVVDEKYLPQFNESIYNEDLDGYIVEQDHNVPNKFHIKKKYINI